MKGDGTFTKSDAEAGEIFCKHFEKVFNNVWPIDESVLDGIEQREMLNELGVTPHPIEVREPMKKMANRKAAGENRIPLEAYKYLPNDNFDYFYGIIIEFWLLTNNPEDFHTAKLYILPRRRISSSQKITGASASSMLPQKLSVSS